jgi:hypothetical protein
MKMRPILDDGYDDVRAVSNTPARFLTLKVILALLFLIGIWFFLNFKIITGEDWISESYDGSAWRTNEGDLQTNGAWDLESHVWKTEYVLKHFPNMHWSPDWYMGMPLFKYYQNAFYVLNVLGVLITGLSAAKIATWLILLGHLFTVLLTFLLCYKMSRRVLIPTLASLFLLSSTFISLRSYGWEPISIVFMFLYPLTLLFFFRQPQRPLRLSVTLLMAITYLSHPLIFFCNAMTMGLYLISLSVRKSSEKSSGERHYIWQFLLMIVLSLLIGSVQFLPQLTYSQVTSGAHMGVSYIPQYHVPYNIITPLDFLFDAGNLKGPSFSVLVALSIAGIFAFINRKGRLDSITKKISDNRLASGLLFVLAVMIIFYYFELWNIFPMNILRSIQYHRIIPEFIIISALVVSSLSNTANTYAKKAILYTILVAFSLSSLIIVYNIQTHWQTIDSLDGKPEFITRPPVGRIAFPYTDQSLSVRNSFNEIPQIYGYYEQGITNSFSDELFSVSSGFHNTDLTIIYLRAANVERLYVNMDEGDRDEIVWQKLSGVLNFTHIEGQRYGYFTIPLSNPAMAQAVSSSKASMVTNLEPGCRVMFQQEYCGSHLEEFVRSDTEELSYLRAYNQLVDNPSTNASVRLVKINPDNYRITVNNASPDTAVIVKMTHDSDFTARLVSSGEQLPIDRIGPDYMIISPSKSGDYDIVLEYHVSKVVVAGAIISLFSLTATIFFFLLYRPKVKDKSFNRGDL